MRHLSPSSARARSMALSLAAVAVAVAAASAAARADAPACRYALTGPVAHDNVTGLTWQRTATSTAYDWAGAKDACATLALGTPSGGWRLPSAAELQTIVDETKTSGPLKDDSAFTDMIAGGFWTATPKKNDPSAAWSLFSLTAQTTAHPVTEQKYVRCVR